MKSLVKKYAKCEFGYITLFTLESERVLHMRREIANEACSIELAMYNHLVSNMHEWNNCFIKNNHKILLDLVDFALQGKPEDNLMAVISPAQYSGSYTMAAKPIKSLELHHTMN